MLEFLTVTAVAMRNRIAALHALGLTRAQRVLPQRLVDAYLGDVPAILPRLQAETDRIRTGLGRLLACTVTAVRQRTPARSAASARSVTS
jgi:hypothetical protein